jgi:hypothetical protein
LLKRATFSSVAAALTSGCVTLSSGPVDVTRLGTLEPAARELTILNGSPYAAEMTLALSKRGFKVKPIASQETITEQRTSTISAQWKQASTRYAMVVQVEGTRQICAFTDYRIVNATVQIVDVKSNETAAILKQRGSDGPCTTVNPVFDTLAEEIAHLWQ